MNEKMRAVTGVLAGFLSMLVGVMVATAVAVNAMVPGGVTGAPTPPYLAVNLLYSFGFAALGGWVAVKVGKTGTMTPAVVLAGIMLLLASVSALSAAAAGQPAWYAWVLVVLGPGGAMLGGKIALRGRATAS